MLAGFATRESSRGGEGPALLRMKIGHSALDREDVCHQKLAYDHDVFATQRVGEHICMSCRTLLISDACSFEYWRIRGSIFCDFRMWRRIGVVWSSAAMIAIVSKRIAFLLGMND